MSTTPARVGSSSGESCLLAGAATRCSGMPCPSVATERFMPCLPRSTGERPATSPPHGALVMAPSTASGVVRGSLVVLASWIVGLVVYFLVVNWDLLPAPAREAIGLDNPAGPVSGLELLGWLAIVTAFQVLFYIGLGGWPTSTIRNPAARIAAANAFVIGGGWLTWALLAKGLGWETPTLPAAGGSGAAAPLPRA